MSVEVYPLQWPDGWPRTAAHQRDSDHRFGGGRKLTMGRAVIQLVNELRLLGASNVVVSSNLPTKSDGLPYADDRRIDDPGIAVYFDFKKHLVMARDGFISVAGNIRTVLNKEQLLHNAAPGAEGGPFRPLHRLRAEITALAARYPCRSFAEVGGLISHGPYNRA